MDIKEVSKDFLRMCATGKPRQAFEKYASAEAVHHNPFFAEDAESLIRGMEESDSDEPDKEFEILRCSSEDEIVFVHSRIRMKRDPADISVVHILEFKEGRIVEFWDIIQVVPNEMVNQSGMF